MHTGQAGAPAEEPGRGHMALQENLQTHPQLSPQGVQLRGGEKKAIWKVLKNRSSIFFLHELELSVRLVDSRQQEAFLNNQNTRGAAPGPSSFTIPSLRRHNDELRNAFRCSDHDGIARYRLVQTRNTSFIQPVRIA